MVVNLFEVSGGLEVHEGGGTLTLIISFCLKCPVYVKVLGVGERMWMGAFPSMRWLLSSICLSWRPFAQYCFTITTVFYFFRACS